MKTKIEIVESPCLCGGRIGASEDGVMTHSVPFCDDFAKVETVRDAAKLLKRVREKMESQS